MANIGNVNHSKFVKSLEENGLVPKDCKRIVINIPYDDIMTISYDINADGDVMDELDGIEELSACKKLCGKCGGKLTDLTTMNDKYRIFKCLDCHKI